MSSIQILEEMAIKRRAWQDEVYSRARAEAKAALDANEPRRESAPKPHETVIQGKGRKDEGQ